MTTINIGEIRINVQEFGQGEPLVLLMGLGGDGALWMPHVEAYRRHFRCIVIDNRGAGLSSKPAGPYSTAMMAGDALGVMDALNIPKAHVSGISMGGAIAQQLAVLAPERIASLTLTCTWDRTDPSTVRLFRTLRALYAESDAQDFQRLLQAMIYVPDYIAEHMDELESMSGAGDRMPAEAFQAQCDACIGHDAAGKLEGFGGPALVTAGERDFIIPWRLSERLASGIRGSRFELFAGGGHAFHWEQLERFNRLTLQFMLDCRQ